MNSGQAVKIEGYRLADQWSEQEQSGEGPSLLRANPVEVQSVRLTTSVYRRLRQLGVVMTADGRSALARAIEKAANGGGNKTLVLGTGLAFLVSVGTSTVTEVYDDRQIRNGISASIDSAVVM